MSLETRRKIDEAIAYQQEAHFLQMFYQQVAGVRSELARLYANDYTSTKAAQTAGTWIATNLDELIIRRINERAAKADRLLSELGDMIDMGEE